MNMNPIERERDLDQWLDAALSQYGKAEPRTGLESRVLANLEAERNRIASRRRWLWAVGSATALAAMVVAVWFWQSGREVGPGSSAGISTTSHCEEARGSIEPAPAAKIAHPAGGYPAKQVATHRPASRPLRDLTVAATPKLDQFPSPRPLSEQEQILMSYVAQYPEKAALVAQAQAEALERDREEEAAEAAKDTVD
jgi:hypothetical protein